MYQYILFDLDGTLTDPKEGITRCVAYALSFFGIEADPDSLTDFIGPPLRDSFKKYFSLSDEQVKIAQSKYRERFSAKGILENRVYEGIPSILNALKKSGKKIALATSKPEVFARQILENYELTDYFDVIVGSLFNGQRTDKAEVIEEALRQLGVNEEDKKSVLMVGDRMHDMIGAKKNGIDALGVYFGYAQEGELEANGATYLVSTVEEMKAFFEKI